MTQFISVVVCRVRTKIRRFLPTHAQRRGAQAASLSQSAAAPTAPLLGSQIVFVACSQQAAANYRFATANPSFGGLISACSPEIINALALLMKPD
jgi:hypothetical protein